MDSKARLVRRANHGAPQVEHSVDDGDHRDEERHHVNKQQRFLALVTCSVLALFALAVIGTRPDHSGEEEFDVAVLPAVHRVKSTLASPARKAMASFRGSSTGTEDVIRHMMHAHQKKTQAKDSVIGDLERREIMSNQDVLTDGQETGDWPDHSTIAGGTATGVSPAQTATTTDGRVKDAMRNDSPKDDGGPGDPQEVVELAKGDDGGQQDPDDAKGDDEDSDRDGEKDVEYDKDGKDDENDKDYEKEDRDDEKEDKEDEQDEDRNDGADLDQESDKDAKDLIADSVPSGGGNDAEVEAPHPDKVASSGHDIAEETASESTGQQDVVKDVALPPATISMSGKTVARGGDDADAAPSDVAAQELPHAAEDQPPAAVDEQAPVASTDAKTDRVENADGVLEAPTTKALITTVVKQSTAASKKLSSTVRETLSDKDSAISSPEASTEAAGDALKVPPSSAPDESAATPPELVSGNLRGTGVTKPENPEVSKVAA